MELTHTELENDWQTNNVVPAPLTCNVSLRIIEWFCQVAVSNKYVICCFLVTNRNYIYFILLVCHPYFAKHTLNELPVESC